MNDTEFYAILSAAITVNSINGLASGTIENLLNRRICRVDLQSSGNKVFQGQGREGLFADLTRMMLLEVIWSILQIKGLLSLRNHPAWLIGAVFLPQLVLGSFYLGWVWKHGLDLALKYYHACKPREKIHIAILFPLYVIAEPVCPSVADWTIMQILKHGKGFLPQDDIQPRDKEMNIPATEQEKSTENWKRLRGKLKKGARRKK